MIRTVANIVLCVGGMAVLAALAGGSHRHVAQIDVLTVGPAPPVDTGVSGMPRLIDDAGKGETAPPALPAGTSRPAFSSFAAPTVLDVVEVRRIADDRVRIRVTSRDIATARKVAEAVRADLEQAGLRERLVIRSETATGRAGLVVFLLGAGALAWLAAGRAVTARHPSAARDPVRHRRPA